MTHDKHDKHNHKDTEKESFGSINNEESNTASSQPENMDGAQQAMDGEMNEESKEESVTIPLIEYASQMKEIDDLKNQIREYSDGWQRERADFSNYRSRILRDQEITRRDITAQIVRNYLAVNDDIELALKNAPENKESRNWVEGIKLIAQKLQNILESEGVQRIPADNEQFDPNRHEAIASEENPQYQSGQIIETIQQGYIIGDRVIRPARVKVAK